jgi:hypothetical protein
VALNRTKLIACLCGFQFIFEFFLKTICFFFSFSFFLFIPTTMTLQQHHQQNPQKQHQQEQPITMLIHFPTTQHQQLL